MPDRAIMEFLIREGLVTDSAMARLSPLAGGVASDIWKVEMPDRIFVVKKALPQLRVTQIWNAPVSRNASEVDWMLEAVRVVPKSVPQILAHDADAGIFAMSYFDPAHYPVWKDELRRGCADPVFAGHVGRIIGKIHAATAGSAAIAGRFANDHTFHSIRIEPYIEATARVHRELGETLLRLAANTLSIKHALVHGDVSPKNILVGPEGPILLDAECAWFGDPAFDLAFCLNHLLLKCLWTPAASELFLASFDALSAAYLAEVTWEPRAEIEARSALLLPALLLARIDGKSPVEYIVAEAEKDRVRRIAKPLIAEARLHLAEIRHAWAKGVSA